MLYEKWGRTWKPHKPHFVKILGILSACQFAEKWAKLFIKDEFVAKVRGYDG